MYNLTLQVYIDATWRDAMVLSFDSLKKALRAAAVSVTNRVIGDNLNPSEHTFRESCECLSFHWIGMDGAPNAPAFVYDIAPAGAAKRFLMRIGRNKPANIDAALYLLARSTRRHRSAICG